MLKLIKFRSGLSALVTIAITFASISTLTAITPDDVPALAAAYADWQVVGPDGGDVRVVAIDPRDKNRLYLSTLDGHIHTSSDGGRSWNLLVNLNKPELILDQLFVDSRDSKIIYTSGHRHKGPGGFFRTTDGGLTWKEARELRSESIHSMTQSPRDPNIIVVGTTAGVWTSKNSGEDWEKVSSSTSPVNVDSLAMDPRNTDTIYAGTWWRAYKTTDAGKNWRLIKDGMIDDSDVFAITLDPRDPEHVIASACSGIYESRNGGSKWAKIQGIPSQSRRTRDIVQHPTIPGTVYAATTEGFWMSTTGGKTWALTTSRNLEINSIAVHPEEPNRIFIGTNNYGVMVSNDGGKNFTPTNDNFSSRFTYSVTPDSQQPDRLYAATHNTATGGGFFFISNDAGKSWLQAKNLDVNRVRAFVLRQDPTDPNQMLLGTNVGVFRSIDRGLSWTQLVPPPPVKKPTPKAKAKLNPKAGLKSAAKAPLKKTSSASAVSKPAEPAAAAVPGLIPAITEKVKVLEYLPAGGGILAGTDNGLYRTRDIAKGWEKIAIDPSYNSNIFAIHISPVRPETIWLGTATSGVLVSHDDGTTWAKAGGAVDNIPVSSIASDPRRPDYIYVGTVQTFYLSRDAGRTWSRRGGNLLLGNYTNILINPDNTNEVLISSSLESDGGIYISTDAGDRWKRVDTKDMKLPSRRVWSIAFDPRDPDRIFAGTHSSGIYKIERTARTSAGM
ncbi:MAG: YCF48-related protein [Pyrinomonadaceae bacterium]